MLGWIPAADEEVPQWEWVNPLPQGHDLNSITTGANLIVAVGGNGTILVSDDGDTWNILGASTGYALNDVAYGNGRFVAVGGATGFEGSPGLGVYLSSTDGWDWDETHRTEYFTPEAVNWNGTQFVAVGRAGRVLVSPDGETWADHDLAVAEWEMVDLVWDGIRYLAVGQENFFTGGNSAFTSTNGTSWERLSLDDGCYPNALAWRDGRYVAVGGVWPGQPCVLTSENGQAWDRVSWEVAGYLQDVTQINAEFWAVGVSGLVASSPDGCSWVFHDRPTGGDLLGLTWTGNDFFTVGEDGMLLSSPTGLDWEFLSSRALGFSHLVEINEVAEGENTFVGVGDYGVIISSPDGASWVQRPSPAAGYLHAVDWTEFGFFAAGDYGIIRSSSGSSWSQALFNSEIRFDDVASGAGKLVAVGWNPSSSSRQTVVATSTDGLVWSYSWLAFEGPLHAVEWTGSRFVAVGSFGLQFESVDGTTWDPRPLDESITLRDLAWSGDRLVAIGGISGVGPLVMTSTGGLNWETVTPPGGVKFDFDDVHWMGNRFVAVGKSVGDSVFFSTDGTSWASESTGTALRLIAVGGNESTVFAFGRGDNIVRRKKPFPYTVSPRRPSGRVLPASIPKVGASRPIP
jgi:hypothetical protein